MEQYPKIIDEKCIACGECIDICPMGTISMKDGKAFVEKSNCSNCRVCMRVCPNNAFKLE